MCKIKSHLIHHIINSLIEKPELKRKIAAFQNENKSSKTNEYKKFDIRN